MMRGSKSPLRRLLRVLLQVLRCLLLLRSLRSSLPGRRLRNPLQLLRCLLLPNNRWSPDNRRLLPKRVRARLRGPSRRRPLKSRLLLRVLLQVLRCLLLLRSLRSSLQNLSRPLDRSRFRNNPPRSSRHRRNPNPRLHLLESLSRPLSRRRPRLRMMPLRNLLFRTSSPPSIRILLLRMTSLLSGASTPRPRMTLKNPHSLPRKSRKAVTTRRPMTIPTSNSRSLTWTTLPV